MSIGDVFSALGAGECSAVGGAGCIGSVEDENENEDEDEQKRDADESQYSKLAGAWNRCNGLRFGERAMPSGPASTWVGKRGAVDPRKWCFRNVIYSGWEATMLNKSATDGAVGQTRRKLDLLNGVASLCDDALSEASQLSILKAASPIVIGVAHDATPRQVSFGTHAESICTHARYIVRKPDGIGWRTVSYDHFLQLKGARMKPKFGVLEIFGQRHSIAFQDEDGLEVNQHIVTKPFVLMAGTASCIFRAEQLGAEQINFNALFQIARSVPAIMVFECCDHCKANKRKVKRCADLVAAADAPGNLYYESSSCGSHDCHTIISEYNHEAQIIGDIHAVEYIAHLPSLYNMIVAGVHRFLLNNLVIHEDIEPPDDYRRHTAAILDMSLMRMRLHVRGNMDDDPFDLTNASWVAEKDDACKQVLDLFNGDVRLDQPEFFGKRGVSRDEVCDQMVAAALNAGLIPGMRSDMPSTIKWGSCSKAMCRQVAGFMIHNILGGALHYGFPSAAGGEDEDDETDFRRIAEKGK